MLTCLLLLQSVMFLQRNYSCDLGTLKKKKSHVLAFEHRFLWPHPGISSPRGRYPALKSRLPPKWAEAKGHLPAAVSICSHRKKLKTTTGNFSVKQGKESLHNECFLNTALKHFIGLFFFFSFFLQKVCSALPEALRSAGTLKVISGGSGQTNSPLRKAC